jgi:hypothetical protein
MKASEQLARILGGDVLRRSGTVFAPAPGHPADDRSMVIDLGWGAEDGLVIGIIRPSVDHRTALEYVRQQLIASGDPHLLGSAV